MKTIKTTSEHDIIYHGVGNRYLRHRINGPAAIYKYQYYISYNYFLYFNEFHPWWYSKIQLSYSNELPYLEVIGEEF